MGPSGGIAQRLPAVAAFGAPKLIEAHGEATGHRLAARREYNQAVLQTWFAEPGAGWTGAPLHQGLRDDLLKVLRAVEASKPAPRRTGSYVPEPALLPWLRRTSSVSCGAPGRCRRDAGHRIRAAFRKQRAAEFSQDHAAAVVRSSAW